MATETDTETGRRTDGPHEYATIESVVAIVMLIGVIGALFGFFIMADLWITLTGVAVVFGAFSGIAALERYRLRADG